MKQFIRMMIDRHKNIFLVVVDCKDTRIAVQVQTNKAFNGRIYALGRSETCNIDVANSKFFRLDLTMTGQDCNTQSVVSIVILSSFISMNANLMRIMSSTIMLLWFDRHTLHWKFNVSLQKHLHQKNNKCCINFIAIITKIYKTLLCLPFNKYFD